MTSTETRKLICSSVTPARCGLDKVAEDALHLHPLFGDNMVLQRDAIVPVWGWAAPGTTVRVTMNGQLSSAVADEDGKWIAYIGPFPAGDSNTLIVSGPRTIMLGNVAVGDVWMCAGQSNMQMGISQVDGGSEAVAEAKHPDIRLFTIQRCISTEPKETLIGHWDACTPTTILSQGDRGGFSAAGYFFGKELNRELNIPIGLIQAAWGGTIAQAWTGLDGLKSLPDFSHTVDHLERSVATWKDPSYSLDRAMRDWWNRIGLEESWFDPACDVSGWKTVYAPSDWQHMKLPISDGVVWFRRSFDVPSEWAGKETILHLGWISDCDSTWINGYWVGQTNAVDCTREYRVPSGVLRTGENTIAIGNLNDYTGGGFFVRPEELRIQLADDWKDCIPLAGEWKCRAYKPLLALPDVPMRFGDNANLPTVIYNGMIAPFGQFGIKGVAWYQGESDVDHPEQYKVLLPALIDNWRRQMQSGDAPFLVVQIAGYHAHNSKPVEWLWPAIRDAQSYAVSHTQNTVLVPTIDIGDADDIHPRNKLDVGWRLYLAALYLAYGRDDMEYMGPTCRAADIKGQGVRVTFDHADGGLVARGGRKLKGFALAGADKQYVCADAFIEGDSVLVSSAKVKNPVSICYAWKSNPEINLYNKANLPAMPFILDIMS